MKLLRNVPVDPIKLGQNLCRRTKNKFHGFNRFEFDQVHGKPSIYVSLLLQISIRSLVIIEIEVDKIDFPTMILYN